MAEIIQVNGLKKSYGELQAVKDITFSVERGTLFAFLGQNGAGKSTTINILCTLLNKTAGEVVINNHYLGKENDAIRKDIGIVFQQSLLDEKLTVSENILTRGNFYGLSPKELGDNYQFVSDYLDIDEIAKQKYGTLSGGQRRRVDIARALIHRPNILFLDEPSTGLDPQARVFVWDAIKKLQKDTGMTVFLTTHYMEEATVASNIIILRKGEIIAEGSAYKLKEQYAKDKLRVAFKNCEQADEFLKNSNIPYKIRKDFYTIYVQSSMEALELLKAMEENIDSFEMIQGTMDDVFLKLVGDNKEDYTK